MKKYYRCKYCFNASHSIDLREEKIHSHTFTLCLSVADIKNSSLFDFETFEEIIHTHLHKYQGKCLNELREFKTIIPSVENIGEALYDSMKQSLENEGFSLYQLEIYENPIEQYSISEQFLLPVEYLADCKNYWSDIVEQKYSVKR